jgi:prepilin-type processing-associated H-X9-DG protein
MDEDSEPKKRSLSPLTILIVVLISVVVWGLLFPSGSHPPGYHIQCTSNLKRIGIGIVIYADDNDGQFPPDLYTLVEQGTIPNDAKLFHCPCIRKEVPLAMSTFADRSAFRTDYWYYPGYSEDNPESTRADEVGIVADKLGNHETHFTGGGTILFADGHAQLFKGKEWYRNSGQSEPPPRN